MKQSLLLALLVCLTVSLRAHARSMGFSSDLSKDFYELCSGDQFEYNGLKLNSFVKMHGDHRLRPIGDYALEESVDYYRLFHSAEADRLEEIRSVYHRNLVEMYGQHYLNDDKFENSMPRKFAVSQANLMSFHGKGKNPLLSDQVLGLEGRKMEKAKNLSLALNAHKMDRPDQDGVLGFDQLLDLFETQLTPFKNFFRQNLTMAFSNDKPADIFKKRIYKFDRFVPVRQSKLIDEWREDSGRLFFDMHIPFEQRDFHYVNKTRPCVEAKELPLFFQLKGKINH